MLGFNSDDLFDDDLCAPLLSFEQALKLSVSFAVSEVGEATFELMDETFLEENGIEERFLPGSLGWLYLGYRTPSPVEGMLPGFGMHVYFRVGE